MDPQTRIIVERALAFLLGVVIVAALIFLGVVR